MRAASPSTASGASTWCRLCERTTRPVFPEGSDRWCRSSRRKVTFLSPSRRARACAWARAARFWSMATTERAQRAMEMLSTPVPQPKSATSSGGSSEASALAQRNQDWPGSRRRSFRSCRSSRWRSKSLRRARSPVPSSRLAGHLDERRLHVARVDAERVVGEARGALLADQAQLAELAQVVAHRGLGHARRRRPARRRSAARRPPGGGCGAGSGRRGRGRTGRASPYQWVFICRCPSRRKRMHRLRPGHGHIGTGPPLTPRRDCTRRMRSRRGLSWPARVKQNVRAGPTAPAAPPGTVDPKSRDVSVADRTIEGLQQGR